MTGWARIARCCGWCQNRGVTCIQESDVANGPPGVTPAGLVVVAEAMVVAMREERGNAHCRVNDRRGNERCRHRANAATAIAAASGVRQWALPSLTRARVETNSGF